MKKIIICIFSIMILLTFTVVVSATSNENAFAAGDGTAENPYQVDTAEQLNAVRNNLSAHLTLQL